MTPEQLDSKIAELVSQRIRMNAPRDYERHFVYALNDEGDATATTLEKTLFRTLFGLSHSYSSTHTEGSSTLDKTIEDALMNTPKIFPDSAFVACQGIEGAYSQIATDKLFANADIMYRAPWQHRRIPRAVHPRQHLHQVAERAATRFGTRHLQGVAESRFRAQRAC